MAEDANGASLPLESICPYCNEMRPVKLLRSKEGIEIASPVCQHIWKLGPDGEVRVRKGIDQGQT